MDTTQTTAPTTSETISHREWARTHADYKTGSPAAGTAKVLRLTATGTVLVPVAVI